MKVHYSCSINIERDIALKLERKKLMSRQKVQQTSRFYVNVNKKNNFVPATIYCKFVSI